MKAFVTVLVVCAAIVIAFEADDVASGKEVSELSHADLSLLQQPGELVLLQDRTGTTTVSTSLSTDADADASATVVVNTTLADNTVVDADNKVEETKAADANAKTIINEIKDKEEDSEHDKSKSDADLKSAEDAEKAADDDEKEKEGAVDDAKAAYDAAKKADAKTDVTVDGEGITLSDAEKKAQEEEDEKKKAVAAARKLKIEFEKLREEYHRAQHKADLLTGVAKKGESFADYQKRKMQEDLMAQRGAAAHLAQTESALNAAKEEEAAARKLKEESEARAKALEEDANAKDAEADRLEKLLAEAIARGEDVTELRKQAEKARADADKAQGDLDKEKKLLEELTAKHEKAKNNSDHLEKKMGALSRLKDAEEQLVTDMKNKLINAKRDLEAARATLSDASARHTTALSDEQSAKDHLETIQNSLSGKEGKAEAVEQEISKLNDEVMEYRSEHHTLVSKVQNASKIQISESTPITEAKRLLMEKTKQLSELTDELLAKINKEKNGLTAKHDEIKKHEVLADAITELQGKVAEAAAATQAAEETAANATSAKTHAAAIVEQLENNVTRDEHAAKAAGVQLDDVKHKEEQSEEAADSAKSEEEHLQEEENEAENGVEGAEKEVEDAADEVPNKAPPTIDEPDLNPPAPNPQTPPTEAKMSDATSRDEMADLAGAMLALQQR